MSIKKLSFVLLSAISLAALLNGCGSSSKEGSPGGVARVASEGVCIVCHAATVDHTSNTNIVADYFASSHNQDVVGCEGCHGGGSQHNGVGPFPYPNPLTADRCITCHTTGGLAPTAQDLTSLFARAKDTTGATHTGFTDNKCAHCHTASGVGSVHAAQVPTIDSDCIKCHDVAAPNHGAGLVNDNNGVRAITTEFAKWSHHVTGVTLNAAHCTACHLEGTVVNGQVVMDDTKHMADNKIHLRNADTDADFAWDPSAPVQADFTGMDNFCMSCHDSNGATSPVSRAVQAVINSNGIAAAGKVASPSNPFGDTISNRYDKMQRPAVVNAKDQFDPANNSHHAVRGKRYSGRTRTAGLRQIATPATFAANSSALLQGTRRTIYDAGNFNALYTPLGTDGTVATGLGDDSTLHCGDCHTVGQWKVGSSSTANGSPTPAAIGAHGSNNEYLLRNTLGTDQRHTQNAFTLDASNNVTYTNPGGAFLVCYNCHAYTRYGSIYVGTGLDVGKDAQPHAGEYDQQGRCNGVGNTLPFNGYTTGAATDGSQFSSRFTSLNNTVPAPYAGEQNPDFGNIFGIQCANCHNSGAGNAYGGIHGSKNNTTWNNGTTTINPDATIKGGAYIDGMGNTTKVERFLPGLGNAMHVPGTLGGFTGGAVVPVNTAIGPNYTYISGGISNDTNWEQKGWQQIAGTVYNLTSGGAAAPAASAGAGCYTLGATQVSGAAIISSDVTSGLVGPSVTGQGGPATFMADTWGACDDHTAGQGKGNHGFIKRIVRPVTY
jgi:hypothetical protein